MIRLPSPTKTPRGHETNVSPLMQHSTWHDPVWLIVIVDILTDRKSSVSLVNP